MWGTAGRGRVSPTPSTTGPGPTDPSRPIRGSSAAHLEASRQAAFGRPVHDSRQQHPRLPSVHLPPAPSRFANIVERGRVRQPAKVCGFRLPSKAKFTCCHQHREMSEGIQHQIWRVRGRPGWPLRRGRSRSLRKPTDGDTDGVRTGWVARDGLVSFVPQVVPRPPVEQLGLLDLARGRRPESSILDCFSASPRAPGPPAVLRKHGRPLPMGSHGRGQVPPTHGAVQGARDPRLLKLPPRGAGVDVRPNLVFKKRPRRQYEIAPVGDRVQLLYDRGHVLAHEAEDVVTEVGTRPTGTRAPHGRLRVRSARSRDRSPAPEHDPPSSACWCPIRACPNGSCVGAHRVCLVRVFGSVSSGLSFRRACRRLVDGPSCGAALGARLVTSLSLLKQSGEVKKREQRHREISEGIQRPSVRSGVSEDAQGGPCGGDDRAHAQAD